MREPSFVLIHGGPEGPRLVPFDPDRHSFPALVHGATTWLGHESHSFLVGEHAQVLDEVSRFYATFDPVTQLANRRTLYRYLERYPTALLLCADIDHLKVVNDRFGFIGGEQALVVTVARLRAHVRWPALLARFGGEEFVAVFPETPRDEVRACAERMRLACAAEIEADPLVEAGAVIAATISIGIGHDLRSAEDNLAIAKRDGRNLVVG